MPRRRRPASRNAPQRLLARSKDSSELSQHIKKQISTDKSAFKPPKLVTEDVSDEEEPEKGDILHESDEEDDDTGDGGNDFDADAPRIAQWVDEEELEADEDEGAQDSEEDESDPGAGPSTLRTLQDDLSSLPLGALRKAQRALVQAKIVDDSDNEDDDGEESGEDEASDPEEQSTSKPAAREVKEKPVIEKRKHKHAPTEVSSKRRPRRRITIEEKRPVPRDPRFLSVTGEFSAERFKLQYGFLDDMHQGELKTLRENLKRARKLLASSPRDLREERAQEVERLERTVKRAESTVNKDRMDKIQQSAFQKARQEERGKQQEGKKAWYMKKADKKELVVRAKFDALAESGGRSAVKKAIEKKQKKVAQKEKKKRPFAPGTAGKRPPSRSDSGRPNKRPRFG